MLKLKQRIVTNIKLKLPKSNMQIGGFGITKNKIGVRSFWFENKLALRHDIMRFTYDLKSIPIADFRFVYSLDDTEETIHFDSFVDNWPIHIRIDLNDTGTYFWGSVGAYSSSGDIPHEYYNNIKQKVMEMSNPNFFIDLTVFFELLRNSNLPPLIEFATDFFENVKTPTNIGEPKEKAKLYYLKGY